MCGTARRVRYGRLTNGEVDQPKFGECLSGHLGVSLGDPGEGLAKVCVPRLAVSALNELVPGPGADDEPALRQAEELLPGALPAVDAPSPGQVHLGEQPAFGGVEDADDYAIAED